MDCHAAAPLAMTSLGCNSMGVLILFYNLLFYLDKNIAESLESFILLPREEPNSNA